MTPVCSHVRPLGENCFIVEERTSWEYTFASADAERVRETLSNCINGTWKDNVYSPVVNIEPSQLFAIVHAKFRAVQTHVHIVADKTSASSMQQQQQQRSWSTVAAQKKPKQQNTEQASRTNSRRSKATVKADPQHPKHKTAMCWYANDCYQGESCNFAHSLDEIRRVE